MILEIGTASTSEILNRLELFRDFIKKSNVDPEPVPGLSKQARANYRNRQNIPASSSLLLWSTNYDLNINWLLTGEGQMLKSDEARLTDPGNEERIQELKLTIELQQKLLHAYESGTMGNNPARGISSAAHCVPHDNERQ